MHACISISRFRHHTHNSSETRCGEQLFWGRLHIRGNPQASSFFSKATSAEYEALLCVPTSQERSVSQRRLRGTRSGAQASAETGKTPPHGPNAQPQCVYPPSPACPQMARCADGHGRVFWVMPPSLATVVKHSHMTSHLQVQLVEKV